MGARRKRRRRVRIEPLFNAAFVRIFGDEGSSKTVTRALVNAVLRAAGLDEIGEIERIDAERTELGGTVDCKSSRFDVRIMAGERLVDLEAQRRPDEIAARSLFYGALMLSSATGSGTVYDDLPQVTVIVLLDSAPLRSGDGLVHVCEMRWRGDGEGGPATDLLQVVVVELEKVRRRYNSLSDEVLADEALSWFYVLTKGFDEEGAMQATAEKFPTIEEFAELYGRAIGDPEVVRAYRRSEESWREENAWKRYFERIKREAHESGMEQGIEQGVSELSAALAKRGVDAAVIDEAVAALRSSEPA